MHRRFALCAALIGLGTLGSGAALSQTATASQSSEAVALEGGAPLPDGSSQISAAVDAVQTSTVDAGDVSPLREPKPLRGVAYDRAFTGSPTDCPDIVGALTTRRLIRR